MDQQELVVPNEEVDINGFLSALKVITGHDTALDAVPLETVLAAIPRVDRVKAPSGTPVLVRIDLDMPIERGKVADMSRIQANSPTIEFCSKNGWKTVMFGHLGRQPSVTVAPVCEAMSAHLGRPIRLVSDWIDEERNCLLDGFLDMVRHAPAGCVFMLENTRKYSIEQGLWDVDASSFDAMSHRMYALASDIRERLAKIEINEAIAASNTDFSSSVLPLLMSHTAMGFHLENEMQSHIRDVRTANAVVFSGLKINKLDDLERVLDRGRLMMIIAAGSLAMALKKAVAQLRGSDFFIGLAETDPSHKAYIDSSRIDQAKRMVRKCEDLGVDPVLPVDFVIDTGELCEQIPSGHAQMDIGPASRALIEEKVLGYIARNRANAQRSVLFYNGVFGKFEDGRFAKGTEAFIRLLRKATREGVFTYVGGGEGRLALLKYGELRDVTHAFTCGGTVLKSMTDKHIAFLKAMYLQNTMRETSTCESGNERLSNVLREFIRCQDFQRLEELADELGECGEPEAIHALISRLGCDRVQEDPDVEDAVCGALVKLGVMHKLGNMNFKFLGTTMLSAEVSEMLIQHALTIPRKYYA